MITAQAHHDGGSKISKLRADFRGDMKHFNRVLVYYSNRQLAMELGTAAVQAVDDESWVMRNGN